MADHHPYLLICARPVFGNSSAPGYAGVGAPIRPEHQVLLLLLAIEQRRLDGATQRVRGTPEPLPPGPVLPLLGAVAIPPVAIPRHD
jgi:hypothetical protein